ncbi:MAG: hypothetical protein ACHBNF_15200 [Chromatiales bacterium]
MMLISFIGCLLLAIVMGFDLQLSAVVALPAALAIAYPLAMWLKPNADIARSKQTFDQNNIGLRRVGYVVRESI